MIRIHVRTDPEECRVLWEALWPGECLFDLWPVRNAFRMHFNHPTHFVYAEKNGRPAGLLALSWIDEQRHYGHFPGELWHAKTWLEQNRMPAASPAVADALLENIPGEMRLRYLRRDALPSSLAEAPVDETGYLFIPSHYGYSFDRYLAGFSGKSRKKLRRDAEPLEKLGIAYRFDYLPDVEKLFHLNLLAFGENSYFHDTRFLNAFEELASWLSSQGLLRTATVLIGGRIAAVDIVAVLKSSCTVLAGGTDPEFPGVAKLINFQHLEWACREKIGIVDFLCGDFGWKERFHLTPRPLYKLDISPVPNSAAPLDVAHGR